jgi:hypothetical protein
LRTIEIATAVKGPIGNIGGAFMISREAKAYCQETGLDGWWAGYMRGRCGVLGETHPDVVTAATVFIPPHTVRMSWEAGRSIPAAEAADRYARVCRDFGRRKLASFTKTDRLAELLEQIPPRAAAAGLPLFSGWRALPLPDDAPGRVLQLAHVVRELRGGLHGVAVLAAGLDPLTAILTSGGSPVASGGGEGMARYFGWPEPFKTPSPEEWQLRADAEAATDALMAPMLEGSDEELIELLTEAHIAIFGA